MYNTVIGFINEFTNNNNRIEVIECFTYGCCYWFAVILADRFNRPRDAIMYDPTINHFGCKINDIIYDITGDVTNSYNWERWEDYQFTEPNQSRLVTKYSILKEK